MHFHPFHRSARRLLDPGEIYDALFGEDRILEGGLVFRCFLPQAYWERRGFIELFTHPAVRYERLPETQDDLALPEVSTKELRWTFDPVKIAGVLSKKNGRDLAFYMEYAFGLPWSGTGNPFDDPEILLEAVRRKFNALNHGEKADMSAKYLLPQKLLAGFMEKVPQKLNETLEKFEKNQNKFFYNFEVVQLCGLLDYLEIRKSDMPQDEEAERWLALRAVLRQCRRGIKADNLDETLAQWRECAGELKRLKQILKK